MLFQRITRLATPALRSTFKQRMIKPLMAVPQRGVGGPVVSGPPQQKIDFMEKMVYLAAMTFLFMSYPTWVMLHIREYRDS